MKALPLLTDALNIAGFVGFGEAPRAEASALAVRIANGMLLEWSTKSIYAPSLYDQSCPTLGVALFTLGGTGTPDIATSPKSIMQVTAEMSGVVFPIVMHTLLDYQEVFPKNITGIPSKAFWDYEQGVSHLYLYPIPQPGMTLRIIGVKEIAQIANAQGDIDLPDDYTEAFVYNLAKRLIPFLPPDSTANPQQFAYIDQIAGTSLSGIKRRNANRNDMAIKSDFPSSRVRGRGNDSYLIWPGRVV